MWCGATPGGQAQAASLAIGAGTRALIGEGPRIWQVLRIVAPQASGVGTRAQADLALVKAVATRAP